MPLGVGRRVQKVWDRLVACRPNNEGVLLRPRGVVMVGWGVRPIFVTWKPNERDVTNRHRKAMSVHVPTYVRSCIFNVVVSHADVITFLLITQHHSELSD
jgi:hypothetical protein